MRQLKREVKIGNVTIGGKNPIAVQTMLNVPVEDITPEVMALADGAGSALGTGGMSTKLRAARMVTSSGADMVIANGAHPELLYDIAEGRAAGTRFAAHRQEA